MTRVPRSNRKVADADIVRLNACGFSLQTVGKLTGIHPTSVTERLKLLGVPPADTRRSFMEDIFRVLDLQQQEWLANELNQNVPVKDYITQLIKDKHAASQRTQGP